MLLKIFKEYGMVIWVEDVLKERDAKLESGEDQLIDWETAKNSLRDSLK